MGNTNFDTVVAALTGNVTGNITGQLTFTTSALAATAGGASISDAGLVQFVNVSSTAATQIIKLPTPTPGSLVMMHIGGTGFELRSSAPATVAINGGTGANAESAIAANTTVFALCVSATAWKAFKLAASGTVTGVEAAA